MTGNYLYRNESFACLSTGCFTCVVSLLPRMEELPLEAELVLLVTSAGVLSEPFRLLESAVPFKLFTLLWQEQIVKIMKPVKRSFFMAHIL